MLCLQIVISIRAKKTDKARRDLGRSYLFIKSQLYERAVSSLKTSRQCGGNTLLTGPHYSVWDIMVATSIFYVQSIIPSKFNCKSSAGFLIPKHPPT